MIAAVKLLESNTEEGTGDAEFVSQFINILWLSFFSQFIQVRVRLTVPEVLMCFQMTWIATLRGRRRLVHNLLDLLRGRFDRLLLYVVITTCVM